MTVQETAKTHPHWDVFEETKGWLAHVAAVEAEIDHEHASREHASREHASHEIETRKHAKRTRHA